MNDTCLDCKLRPECKGIRYFGVKGRQLGYTACSYGVWPITNGEKIRAMSNEELAEWLKNNEIQFYTQDAVLEYLNQEAT